jgi:hypothetical protein
MKIVIEIILFIFHIFLLIRKNAKFFTFINNNKSMFTKCKEVIFNISKKKIKKSDKEVKETKLNDPLLFNESYRKESSSKKRSPWSKEEDDAITQLVEDFGTKNWTLIANKIAEIYNIFNRSGKQCRERWHNHLDPEIKKDFWTEKEEIILFQKHKEFGNKWSDIAKSLPGRTDNSIKNHFYSKLRKFIRKILKTLTKENVFKENNIDPVFYNSDRIYKIIKKQNIPYNSLNKESIVDLIIKHNIHTKEGTGKRNSNSFYRTNSRLRKLLLSNKK